MKLTNQTRKLYIVKRYGGIWDDYCDVPIFVTMDKKTATKYVTKFNKILKKWKVYYSQFEEPKYGITWIKNEFIDKYYRWDKIRNITKCYYEEIELR